MKKTYQKEQQVLMQISWTVNCFIVIIDCGGQVIILHDKVQAMCLAWE